MVLDVILGHHDGTEADSQRAAAVHRITGIDAKVHDDLLDHAAVPVDEGEFRRRGKFQSHGFAEQPPQHLAHVGDDFPQINRFDLHHILPAEHEQLPRKTGRAFRGEEHRLG